LGHQEYTVWCIPLSVAWVCLELRLCILCHNFRLHAQAAWYVFASVKAETEGFHWALLSESVSLTSLVLELFFSNSIFSCLYHVCIWSSHYANVMAVIFKNSPQKKRVEIESCAEWGLRLSASADHRQTRWGLHQRGWLNYACAKPQRWLCHELAWIWTDFLSEQRRTTDLVETAVGRAANDNLHDASARLKISSQ